ncbi:hypothetical protein VB151_08665 [Xanthomonas fragariae]|uniref:hypothetical protein n=1 Tax=Xanthomonas fragariae TaxID=48664 RepID=UPI0003271ADC|nr:hypothetical protein [Xanthomonas fragariae]ENZ94361.1 hypothetical protein O1K_16226 [Xanthomonas fragariae LMG 25863]MBL9197873.1 hypothetical protein [Xanthomonas fragariae]MBL9219981.1 hypothetical protein [Xanthomonas fragariae]MDM7554554.1 hypothetical protein [Xanthomonas fragariae]MDM7557711.1 hypothetical protein [Xanthomonas fragariae]
MDADRRDRRLCAVVPGTFAHVPTLVADNLLGFFVFALLDEAWLVTRSRAQIAPALRHSGQSAHRGR